MLDISLCFSLTQRALWLCLLIPQQRRPVGHIRCARMLDDWLVDWKEADMSLEDRLSVPDGPLSKNRRQSRKLCPRKTTSCQLNQALLRRGKEEAKRNKEVILLGSVASTASSFHLYQLVGYSQEPLHPHVTLQVSTHLCTIRWTWRKNTLASWFYFLLTLPSHSFNHFSSFFFFFWKKFICCQRESVVFVINVVEIQICPPRKGVFINSHSPEN